MALINTLSFRTNHNISVLNQLRYCVAKFLSEVNNLLILLKVLSLNIIHLRLLLPYIVHVEIHCG